MAGNGLSKWEKTILGWESWLDFHPLTLKVAKLRVRLACWTGVGGKDAADASLHGCIHGGLSASNLTLKTIFICRGDASLHERYSESH